ncbi:diacylglycerol kinase (ATP) [Actinopolymorpha cephalotaxi]|uniref:Diacylglycerol kinase (ATP) n=1 Tax=Actinopolymorpha cephalotaxi TaxID=504797 RepID=A0A1I2YE41_9ACTN|nr:diacylglycerol kinase family protein [Actinopolymorpha cephalotaxi]NYH87015.1 diacylglycerol kinase (ATP) [Actinopolymorpha cephalotaxi]SFH23958.1 diacylglycerol kinase (ATP) [Actinopolymorpha cephalotaxi]
MLVIANKDAGSTEPEEIERALEVLRADGPTELVYCQSRDHLQECLDARAGRPVVVIGGDGSLHTTVSALYARGELADTPLGLIPLGTGNDLARGLDIPLDAAEAAEIIRAGALRPMDLIADDSGGVVVNAVHVGAGAEAAQAAHPLKPRLGPLAFPLGAIVAGLRTKGWRLTVVVDGRTVARPRHKTLMVGLANAPSIAGGTAQLSPGAVPHDGQVDVVVSHSVGRLARLGYALHLTRGRHTSRDDVVSLRGREVVVSGEEFFINADGEVTGPRRHTSWRVLPGAWRMYLPSGTPTEADPDPTTAAAAGDQRTG